MRYDLETLTKLDNFIDSYLKEQFEKYVGLNGRDTILDKIEHINRFHLNFFLKFHNFLFSQTS